ncbi:MAG: c-type cytochrome [Betaproteobacteria bacterium]
MRERVASIVVALAIIAIVGGVAWSGGVLGYPDDGRAFNLTGVGSVGRWTLEPVNGLNYWWKDFAPATLFIRTGDDVVIHLRSADVFHRFYIPEFAVGPVDVEPGHTVTVRFKASHKGVFQFYCTSMCGSCHFYMRGWVVVTDRGDTPIVPPPLECGLCVRAPEPIPTGASLVETGALLYRQKGCSTCHGLEGRGGVANDNSTNGTVPAHNTTAQKLFLRTREDADAFIRVVEASSDLGSVEDADVTAFPVVRTRFLNAKEIVRKGRFTARADPHGPQPPLQMPAWQYLIEERQIDALLAYFVSLQNWDEAEQSSGTSR